MDTTYLRHIAEVISSFRADILLLIAARMFQVKRFEHFEKAIIHEDFDTAAFISCAVRGEVFHKAKTI